MSAAILEAIRAEITAAEQRLDVLRDLEQRAGSLDGAPPAPPEPPPAPAPAKARAATTRPRRKPAPAGEPERELDRRIIAVLGEHGELAPREIASHLGDDPQRPAFQRALKRLLNDGRVEAHGSRQARRYRVAGDTRHRARTEAGKARTARTEDRRVRAVGLRARVLELIRQDPAALTEERLAQALNADREEIADACGALLLTDAVAFNPDRTYSPAANVVAA